MRYSLQRLPIFIAAASAAVAAAICASAKTSDADEQKADYIFLEAQNAYLDKKYDKYIQLVYRAYDLDSADVDIAAERGLLVLMDDESSQADREAAYKSLKNRFHSNTGNYYAGAMFANVAAQWGRFDDAIDTWKLLDSIFPKRSEPSLELADVYLQAYVAGDSSAMDKALDIYNRIESGTGKSLSLLSYKTKAYSLANDTAAIVRELAEIDSAMPNSSQTALYVGAIYEHLNKPQTALEYYDKACALDSANGMAYAARADIYHFLGDSVAYDREVFNALKSDLDIDSKLMMLRSYVADLYTDTAQQPRIVELFNTLENINPGEPEIHSLYGAYLYTMEDYQGAAEQFSYAAGLDQSNEEYHTSWMQSCIFAGDTIQAINVAQETIKKFPDNLRLPIFLSSMHLQMGDTIQALAAIDSVKIDEVRNAHAVATFIASKGDIYAAARDTARALEIYDEALRLDPANNMALNNAAYFMALSGADLDKAESYSLRSLKGDDLNPTYLDTYAWILFLKKDFSMAKMYIDMALNAYPKYINMSPEDLKKIIDNESPTPELIDAAEQINDLTDRNDETDVDMDSVERVVDDIPSAEILDHAGDIYFMNGDSEKALHFWQLALVIEPQNPTIQKKVEHRTIFK